MEADDSDTGPNPDGYKSLFPFRHVDEHDDDYEHEHEHEHGEKGGWRIMGDVDHE
jgi:hypothetical protein